MGDDSKKPLSKDTAATKDGDAGGDVASGGTTRRGFVAGVGAAAAVATTSKVALAGKAAPRPLYRIHPAIGIARVGNADPNQQDGYFIGPEVPGYPTLQNDGPPLTPHKDSQGNVRPQAARFRIFEYAYIDGRLTPFREVNLQCSDVASITWTVHIANRKASFHLENGSAGDSTSGYPLPATGWRNPSVTDRRSLENDFGPRSIAGASAGPVDIDAPSPNNVPPGQSVALDQAGNPVIDYMGQLRTDYAGRLVFLGGKGKAASSTIPPTPLTHWSNNDTWFDDVGDGPVTATVTLKDGRSFSVDCTDSVSGKPWIGSAWVLVTPPKHAPGMQGGCISLYDLVFDISVRELTIPPESVLYDDGGPLASLRNMQASFAQGGLGADVEFPGYVPDFATEIWPMLLASYNYRWTTELVNAKMDSLMDPSLADPSSASLAARGGFWQYIRQPVGAIKLPGNRDMPRLRGDDPYQGQSLAHYMFAQTGPGVTKGGDPDAPKAADIASNIRSLPVLHTQWGLYQNWAAGPNSFTAPQTFPPQLPSPVITPHGLDQAAMENCIGGAFCPGIEVGWQVRHPALWAEPFRLNPNATSMYLDQDGNPEGIPVAPGHFSRQQALPWHADFNDCQTEGSYGWWPSARPTAVLLNPTDSLNKRVAWARPSGNKFASGTSYCDYPDMLANWYKFGFVDQDPVSGGYYEVERATDIV
jgi:hypothetical protein